MPVLSFKGKTAVETYHHTVPHHTLEFDKKLSCLPKGQQPSLDGNLIIEGDNLLALKALLPTHAGRIKCIYIDPPYNTGNEGWVYNDNLTQPQFKEWIGRTVGKEGEDACRHDKWCCMMYPRLMLLKELLAEEGILLVSIDGLEAHNLRCLLDEVFGDDRRLGEIVWKTRNTDNRVKTNLSVDHEYVLVYGKSQGARLQGRVIDRSDFQNPDDDPHGPYVTDPLTGKATAEQRPNLHFVVENPETGDRWDPDPSRGWITDPAGMKKLIREKRVWWPPDPNTGKPRKKRYLFETKERMPESTFWADIRGQSGADEVDLILGERLFDFPKLTDFIARLLDLTCGNDAIILDSTAGSGTTGHAVLKLNHSDDGDRTFILVQQPYDSKSHENDGTNICRKVTAERVRKAIKGYAYTKPKRGGGSDTHKVDGLRGSFTYARVSDLPLLGEYRDLGERPPAYDDIAKYVFYTETSRQWDKAGADKETGKIGEHAGTSYYLLYRPNRKADWPIDMDFLKTTAKKDPSRNLVVYCEKIWLHRADLREWEQANKKKVRPMLVPFNLK